MRAERDVLARFGARVRRLHTEAGYSQEGFAELCGLDRTYIGGIKRGERNVSLRNIELIARAMRLSIAELMKGV